MFIQSFIHSFKRGHQYSAAVWMRILHLFNKQTGLKECADSLELFFFFFSRFGSLAPNKRSLYAPVLYMSLTVFIMFAGKTGYKVNSSYYLKGALC